MKLTKKEQLVMEVIWANKSALCVSDIIDKNKNLKKNTVSSLVKKLTDAGILYVAEIKKNEKTLTQYYKAAQSREEFLLSELSKKDAFKFAAAFIDKCIDNEELIELEKLIENKKSYKYDGD